MECLGEITDGKSGSVLDPRKWSRKLTDTQLNLWQWQIRKLSRGRSQAVWLLNGFITWVARQWAQCSQARHWGSDRGCLNHSSATCPAECVLLLYTPLEKEHASHLSHPVYLGQWAWTVDRPWKWQEVALKYILLRNVVETHEDGWVFKFEFGFIKPS